MVGVRGAKHQWGKASLVERLPEEMVIQTHHLRLGAKRWRVNGGLPVLGLHGWLDNANTFDRLAPLLPQFDLVSLDLPGHGKSDHRPTGTRYHFTDYVDEVMAAADALGWKRFIVLGHSMGAGIGCLAASAYPDRVQRLILIESLGPVTEEAEAVPGRLRRSIEAMKPQLSKKPAAYHDLAVLIRARAAAGHLRRDSAEIIVRRSVQSDGDEFFWRSDPRLKCPFPQYFSNEVVVAFLEGISSPVLLITAADGMLRKRAYFQSRCRAIKYLHTITLAGHHHLHIDDPLPVAKAIQTYLSESQADL